MSRTWKTDPHEVKVNRLRKKNPFLFYYDDYRGQFEHYPWWPFRGGWNQGVRRYYRKLFNRQFRQQCRQDLHHEREPETRFKRDVSWYVD
jgi:hypothetical protein